MALHLHHVFVCTSVGAPEAEDLLDAGLVGVTNGHPELEGVYEEQGLDVFFDVVHGAGHGGDEFYMGDQLKHALHFMGRTMAR